MNKADISCQLDDLIMFFSLRNSTQKTLILKQI